VQKRCIFTTRNTSGASVAEMFKGWFYLSVILLISAATILTALIIMVQKKGYYGHRVPRWVRTTLFDVLSTVLRMRTPVRLMEMRKMAEVPPPPPPPSRSKVTLFNCCICVYYEITALFRFERVIKSFVDFLNYIIIILKCI